MIDRSLTSWAGPKPERYLSATHVAILIDVHVNTVKRMGDRGDIPFVRINDRGDRRYLLSGLLGYLSRRHERDFQRREVPVAPI